MDRIRNPYSPGAGSPPPELVGRDPILEQAQVLLGRAKARRAEKSLLLTGLRGVGKTVLLNELERLARSEGFRTVPIEASEGKSLAASISQSLRPLLFELDRGAGRSEKVRHGLSVLRSFMGTVKLSVQGLPFGLDIEPAKGSADSGDLEMDLPALFVAIGEAAQDRNTGVAILIDEIQYYTEKELGALIMAMHRVQQRQLPIVLFGAGLPVLPGLAGQAKSYAERLFNFPDIGALSEEDAAKALQDPAVAEGVRFESDALHAVYEMTHGYPYFLQEWGYQAWNSADTSPLTVDVIRSVTEQVIARLDQNFFRVRFDRLTPGEKTFLRTMARLGAGPNRISDIADALGVKVNALSPVRAQLIKKGMIYSPAHGELAFTVPLFDGFMKRAMPGH